MGKGDNSEEKKKNRMMKPSYAKNKKPEFLKKFVAQQEAVGKDLRGLIDTSYHAYKSDQQIRQQKLIVASEALNEKLHQQPSQEQQMLKERLEKKQAAKRERRKKNKLKKQQLNDQKQSQQQPEQQQQQQQQQ